MMTEEWFNCYYEDDTQLEIPEEILKMSSEELKQKAKELLVELKKNPLYPAREKPEIKGIKFCI